MAFKCAVVGLPNVGKSTFFNAVSNSEAAQAENYPFCTIEPNVGMVEVPDERLQKLAEIAGSKQVIATSMHFVDVAGLVKGASQGEGLGNKFLAHIRETQAICHVVRCFEDKDVTHVSGGVDPVSDIETIDTELILADMQTVDNALKKLGAKVRSGDKLAKQAEQGLIQIKDFLDKGQSLRDCELDESAGIQASLLQLLTIKPIMFVGNVDESGDGGPALEKLKAYTDARQATLLTLSAKIESELAMLDEEEKLTFLQEMGYKEPGLFRVIRAGHQLLGLQQFFTAGPKEARAWTVAVGATAVEAAGVIHTDFIKSFVRAEVIPFQAYLDHQGEAGAKAAGLWRLEGKDYVVQDGDVIYFRIA
jgi:ribosome-binding ATPase